MGTPYEGGYLWPPRPTVAAAREFFPDGPFAGQAKMNGRTRRRGGQGGQVGRIVGGHHGVEG
jgi:hypothetical protein